MAFAMAQRRAGAHHQKLAQVGVEGSNLFARSSNFRQLGKFPASIFSR
jgi:hypothetical protein